MYCSEQILEAVIYKTASIWSLPLISENMPVRWTKHAACHKKRREKLISDILMWTPPHGHTRISWLAKSYIHHLCADTGYSRGPTKNDRQEGLKGIHAIRIILWWGVCVCMYIYIYIYIYMIDFLHVLVSFLLSGLLHCWQCRFTACLRSSLSQQHERPKEQQSIWKPW